MAIASEGYFRNHLYISVRDSNHNIVVVEVGLHKTMILCFEFSIDKYTTETVFS